MAHGPPLLMKTERARPAPYSSYWRGKHVSEGRHFVRTLLPGGRRRGWRGALAGEAAPGRPATPKEATAVISIVGDEEFYVGKELVTREALIEKVKQTLKGEEPGGQDQGPEGDALLLGAERYQQRAGGGSASDRLAD